MKYLLLLIITLLFSSVLSQGGGGGGGGGSSGGSSGSSSSGSASGSSGGGNSCSDEDDDPDDDDCGISHETGMILLWIFLAIVGLCILGCVIWGIVHYCQNRQKNLGLKDNRRQYVLDAADSDSAKKYWFNSEQAKKYYSYELTDNMKAETNWQGYYEKGVDVVKIRNEDGKNWMGMNIKLKKIDSPTAGQLYKMSGTMNDGLGSANILGGYVKAGQHGVYVAFEKKYTNRSSAGQDSSWILEYRGMLAREDGRVKLLCEWMYEKHAGWQGHAVLKLVNKETV